MHLGSILPTPGLSPSRGEPGLVASKDWGVPQPNLQHEPKTGPLLLHHLWCPPWALRTYGACRSLVDPWVMKVLGGSNTM